MVRHNNIMDAIQVNCPFPHFFDEAEQHPKLGKGYRRQIVYIRADYDGRRWWNTIWPYHDEMATPEIRREVDAVYAALISKGAFENLNALRSFCAKAPQELANKTATEEYNFYLESVYCGYWIQCITRSKDYNLYLHAFLHTDPTLQMHLYLDKLEALQPAWERTQKISALMDQFPALAEDRASEIVLRWERCFKTEGHQDEHRTH